MSDFYKILGNGITPLVSSLTYPEIVLADVPYAYWRFEETTAAEAVADSSGNEYHATNGASIEDSNCAVAGIVVDSTSATEFDGSPTDVVLPPAMTGLHIILAAGPVTFEGWIQTTTTLVRDAWRFAPGAPGTEIKMRVNGGSIQGAIRVSLGGKTFQSENIGFNNGSTHYFAVILDGLAATCRLFLDNVEKTLTPSGTFTPALDTFTENTLMASSENYTIAGVLDEFAIYSRALTEAEIAEHYAAGIAS